MKESVIYQEIEAQGKEKGIALGIEQVALNLLREGMSIDVVMRVTGLTVERLQQLQRGQ